MAFSQRQVMGHWEFSFKMYIISVIAILTKFSSICENGSFQRASSSHIITESIRWTLISESVDILVPILSLKTTNQSTKKSPKPQPTTRNQPPQPHPSARLSSSVLTAMGVVCVFVERYTNANSWCKRHLFLLIADIVWR